MSFELKLLAGNSNRPLAEKISNYLGVPLTDADVSRFKDGEVSVKINENIRGTDLFIIQPTQAPAENLIELLVMIDSALRASARRITAVIPYFGYARQDRKDQPRVPISAKLMANLITTAGANRVLTMDLHASQIQGFFDIPLDHLYSAPIFVKYFSEMEFPDLVVVAPDHGGVEMARAYAKRLGASLAFIDKRRPHKDRAEVVHVVGRVRGKTVIIQDDIINTGETLTKGALAIKEREAKEVYACCTHPVLSQGAVEGVEKSPISKLSVSDTIPLKKGVNSPKIEVISVSDLLGEAIGRIHREESVSSLFY